MNTAEIIFNALRKKGYTIEGVCGLLGNLAAESALRPDNLEDSYQYKWGISDKTYINQVDAGTRNFIDSAGFGLAQWTFGTRKSKLLAFARQRGVSIADLDMQIDFLDKELREDYPYVYGVLRGNAALKDCSDVVLIRFENPAGAEQQKNYRYSLSKSYYDQFKDDDGDFDSDSCDDSQLREPDDDGPDFSILPVLSQKKYGNADNAWVSVMQGLLWKSGYALHITDRFDNQTLICLKEFQEDHELDADGICGRNTWNTLVRCET